MIILYDIRGILKFLFNLAILMIIGKLFYAPFAPELQDADNTFKYYLPIVGVIGSYLYLAAWFGWKLAYTIMKYFSVFLFLLFYPALEHELPTWASTTINIFVLSIVVYMVYRVGKFLFKHFQILRFRFISYTSRLKNRRQH